jgi:uncharacterized membrane protein
MKSYKPTTLMLIFGVIFIVAPFLLIILDIFLTLISSGSFSFNTGYNSFDSEGLTADILLATWVFMLGFVLVFAAIVIRITKAIFCKKKKQ